jgi:hypothetical protein
MDITLTWALPINQLPTDEYDVLYKVWDSAGINNWVLANTTPLPPTTTTYTITGLNPNTIYRVAVTKSCVGGGSYVDEATYVNIVCPLISFWQGPVVNSEQTLFYSVNYPDATHVTNTEILVYDTTFDDRFLADCGAGPTAIPIGRTSYQIADGCTTPNIISCVKQGLEHKVPNNGSSAVGYYGLDTMAGFNPFICDGATGDPLLFRAGNTYKFELITIIDTVTLGVTIDFSTFDTSCNVVATAPVYTMPSNPVPDSALLSSAICFDPLTGLASFTTADGTGTTNINDYSFSYSTSDGSVTLPLLDNVGNIVSSYNGSYNIYAPIKIQSAAPGGGNSLGYTITNASVSGTNVTYTYTGGTNAFTVGQEVFVNSVNPITFNFSTISKVITAATSNSFTVTISPAPVGTYQTGGIASGYLELTDGMTVTVDLQFSQNVITLTNQNYSGLTLIQALTQVATAINTAGTYTASAVVIAGLPYLKIDVPDSTYVSASVIFEGPNILTKGSPDILQTSEISTLGFTPSTINYNGFLYASFVTSGYPAAKIVASSYTNIPAAVNYSHTINTGISEMLLVPEAPPTTVYSLDRIASGGDYSLNITVAETPSGWNEGYSYIANNTTISVYNGTTLIDSKDISTLFGGSNNPIRLMEYNNTDNYLYVFIDGSSNNFHIILHTGVGSWSIGHTGTYAQTNYLQGGTITAWTNLTSGATAALGTMTSVTAPNPIPNPPNTTPVNSVLFQDTAKTGWNIVPPATQSYSPDDYYVYNSDQNSLGEMFYYRPSTPPYIYPGITGGATQGTVNIIRGINTSGVTVPFLAAVNDNYGIFHKRYISDYNASPLFNDRVWANTSRYLIKSGRSGGSNGFLDTTTLPTDTTFKTDSYIRYVRPKDKQIDYKIGLDGTSEYLLFDITDGGTCYNKNNNRVFVSLAGGLVQVIPNSGTPIVSIQLYKDFPTNTIPVQGSLQMIADPNSNLVYGIARDARSDIDDMNIYVFNESGQVDVIDGSALWNVNICGQISIDSTTGILYFTGKHTRNFYEYDPTTGLWDNKIIPSVYEKMNGFTYGTASPLSRLQGVIERVQGASHIGGGKFVVMNYMQQTYSTELKYVYECSNLFVYDYVNNTVDQVLIGTGVNTYSGPSLSYNPNYYGESLATIDYNTDYCYGGLGIKVDSNGRIFFKKSLSDQVYMLQSHAESGIAQIWGTGVFTNSGLIRIWNIQSDGSLQQSKRTIYDGYVSPYNLKYDSFSQRVIAMSPAYYGGYQFNIYNPKNLAGAHSSPNQIGIGFKTINTVFANGITPSLRNQGKPSYLYSVSATATEITYNLAPDYYNPGVFPHHFSVGDIVTITRQAGLPIPAALTNVPITSVTQTSFTVANPDPTFIYPLTVHRSPVYNVRLSTIFSIDYGSIIPDNAGNIFIWGLNNNTGTTFPVYTSMFVKFDINDLFSQRESPSIIVKSIVSSPCSATPNGVFLASLPSSLLNYSVIGPTNQGTLWMLGSRNPTCSITGITGATYDPIAQKIRYTIANSFSAGKVVNITGVNPPTYNLTRVPIIAADPTGFEISYTGTNPGTFVPPTPPAVTGTVELSRNWVIEVVDFTSPTFNTIATIDLAFANAYLDTIAAFNYEQGSFQYSAAEDKVYLYYGASSSPVYTFDTITNSLIRSSSFNRMVLPYTKLNYVYTVEDVNGIAYFSAGTSTDTPSRRWFRLAAGNRSYINDVHNELNVIVNDGSTTTTTNYNLYSLSNIADTFGQWKVTTSTTWASIPGGSNITVNANEIIEFTMFSTTNTLVSVENVTTSTVYDIPSYNNLSTFPTYNTLNSVLAFVIQADSVNLSNGDVLEFTFQNPDNPTCPFINSVTINF